jgi:transcriptional regulator with XRE-family HTH domain
MTPPGEHPMSESHDTLKEDFKDEEYRHAYAEDFLNTSIATQIRVLREQQGLTQEDLAKKIGTKQAGVSRLENVNHSAWKTDTLHKIARAFDVRLKITFETFGTLLDEADGFSRKNLERSKFDNDPTFHEKKAAPSEAVVSSVKEDNPFLTRSFRKTDNVQNTIAIGILGLMDRSYVSAINVGQIAMMVRSVSALALIQNRIPSQFVKSTDATYKGEIRNGGRAAA